MLYNFDWDPAKERANIHKHRLNFQLTATIFSDPNQVSIFDEEHSTEEDRWITIGIDSTRVLRVIVHTFEQVNENLCEIRIISARKAEKYEIQQYQGK